MNSRSKWIERPPGVREVMGSIPVRDSYFLFVPRSCHVVQFTFHISWPSLKVNIFIHLVYPLLYRLDAYDIRGRQTLAFFVEHCPQISDILDFQEHS